MKFFLLIFLFTISVFANVGKVVYIKGDVFVLRDKELKPAAVGMDLKQDDVLSTQKDSLVKLLLEDKSAISIGSNSEFNIEKYFYDETKNSEAQFKMRKGVFRIITGKVAKLSPERFKLKTKTVTIGIRGTIFSGELTAGKERFFCEKGMIYVTSQGVTVDIPKGSQTAVVPGKRPELPKPYKLSDLHSIHAKTTGWKNKECVNP